MKVWLWLAAACAIAGSAAVTDEKLKSAQADAGSWLMYGRNYSGWRYSELTQINAANVAKLATKWIFQSGAGPLETTLRAVYSSATRLLAESHDEFTNIICMTAVDIVIASSPLIPEIPSLFWREFNRRITFVGISCQTPPQHFIHLGRQARIPLRRRHIESARHSSG